MKALQLLLAPDTNGAQSQLQVGAAEELARYQRIEAAYLKAVQYASVLRESDDDENEYWGQKFSNALALDTGTDKAKPAPGKRAGSGGKKPQE